MPKRNTELKRTFRGWVRIHKTERPIKPLNYEQITPGVVVQTGGEVLSSMHKIIPFVGDALSKQDVFKMLGAKLSGKGIKTLPRV